MAKEFDFDALPWMHIYGQFTQHDTAKIVGNVSALKALRDAIDAAIKDGKAEAKNVCTTDGEGYGVLVERTNLTGLRHTRLPYISYLRGTVTYD